MTASYTFGDQNGGLPIIRHSQNGLVDERVRRRSWCFMWGIGGESMLQMGEQRLLGTFLIALLRDYARLAYFGWYMGWWWWL
jgi:hypothetical protein